MHIPVVGPEPVWTRVGPALNPGSTLGLGTGQGWKQHCEEMGRRTVPLGRTCKLNMQNVKAPRPVFFQIYCASISLKLQIPLKLYFSYGPPPLPLTGD